MPAARHVALAVLFACAACARPEARRDAPPPPVETAAPPTRQPAEARAAANAKAAKPEAAATAKSAKPEAAATASAKPETAATASAKPETAATASAKTPAAAPHKPPETAGMDRKAAETAQAARPPAPSKPVAAPATPPAPPEAAAHATRPLDLKSLEQRLKDSDAIGVMTKLALRNQVNDLLGQFRDYYEGRAHTTLAELRRPFDLLLMKVLSLLQDRDPALARTIQDSRAALWAILSDRAQFEKLS